MALGSPSPAEKGEILSGVGLVGSLVGLDEGVGGGEEFDEGGKGWQKKEEANKHQHGAVATFSASSLHVCRPLSSEEDYVLLLSIDELRRLCNLIFVV